MASRIMHYAIASIVAEDIGIRNRTKFILGNLEPDISSKQDGSYSLAHFSDKNEVSKKKGINYKAFALKYQDSILNNEEVLGYFCHLIADACWLKLMREKHIRVYSDEKRKEMVVRGYAEMHLYNSVLIRKYHLNNELEKVSVLRMEEVNPKYIEQFLEGLRSDFEISEESENQFVVYPYDEVMDYISYTIRSLEGEISNLKKGKELSNPEQWYVGI